MEKLYFSANHQTDVQIDTTRERFISKGQENLLWYPSTKAVSEVLLAGVLGVRGGP